MFNSIKHTNEYFRPTLTALAVTCCLHLAACSSAGNGNDSKTLPTTQQSPEAPVVTDTIAEIKLAQEQQTYVRQKTLQQHSVARRMIAPTASNAHISVQGFSGQAGHGESYQTIADHGVQLVTEQPVSTFSADVDTASYANVRRWLEQGRMPPKDAVRVEELINYFHYQYPQANSLAQPIAVDTLLTPSPWNQNRHLLRVGVSSYQEQASARPNANVVLLIDVSGSMRAANKLPLVQQSLKLMLAELKPDDRVSIVTYANGANVVLPSTAATDVVAIEQAILSLAAGGSTNGGAGIELAYQQAQQGFIENGINQIMLMSDGDLNVGVTDRDELKQYIEVKRQQGVHFSTIGYGQGNYNDALMEQLADIGNGMAGYIDNLHEAQKLLVDQLGSSLQVVAHDVKLQVEFNPAVVSEYRLVGYENRQLAREDFNQDGKDAGDMGAGHTVTAIYELTLEGEPGSIEPLVFQSSPIDESADKQTAAEIRVRYKTAQGQASELLTQRIGLQHMTAPADLSTDDQFAFAVAAFAQKLRRSDYLANFDYAELTEWANQNKGLDPFGYRAEFVRLTRLADGLAQQVTLNSTAAKVAKPPIVRPLQQ